MSVLGGYVTIALATAALTLAIDFAVPSSFDHEALQYRPPWGTVLLACGFPIAVLGGYTTSRLARGAELAHALALAALVFVMWIVYVLIAPEEIPGLYQAGIKLAGVLGVLIGGCLGAYLRARGERTK